MKTFETEKHNIPEGATHYRNECKDFTFVWVKQIAGKEYVWDTNSWYEAVVINRDLEIAQIPQTNIETPEEKEALDSIDVKLIKPREPSKLVITKVEWGGDGLPPVGVECEWIGGGLNHGDWGLVVVHAYHNDFAWIEKLRDNSMHTVGNPAHFRKPETPQQREERERLEVAYDLYRKIQIETSAVSCESFESFKINEHAVKLWIAIVDKTNYRERRGDE